MQVYFDLLQNGYKEKYILHNFIAQVCVILIPKWGHFYVNFAKGKNCA